jgi:hypothetical protein
MESVTCDLGRSGVFGQPVPRASAPRWRNFPALGLVARSAELAAKCRPSSIDRITFGLPVNRSESGLANPGRERYRMFATVILSPCSAHAETAI